MPKEQRTFTKEFKLEAVRLVQTSGKSITQVARDLLIADSTLHHWCKLLAEQGEQAFPGSGHQTAEARGASPPQTRVGSRAAGTRYLKKSCSHLLTGCQMKYGFIAQHQQDYPVQMMCQVLDVSVSGYYAWKQRPANARQIADERLSARIRGCV